MEIANKFSKCDQNTVIAILANSQSNPIGRTGKWISTQNQLICSLIFGSDDNNYINTLLIKTAVSIYKKLIKLEPQSKFTISYPNDIYKNGRKLCGILQVFNDKCNNIVGFGINQGQQDQQFQFASLEQQVDQEQFVRDVIQQIIQLSDDEALKYFKLHCQELCDGVLRQKDGKTYKILDIDFPCTAKALNINTHLVEFLFCLAYIIQIIIRNAIHNINPIITQYVLNFKISINYLSYFQNIFQYLSFSKYEIYKSQILFIQSKYQQYYSSPTKLLQLNYIQSIT